MKESKRELQKAQIIKESKEVMNTDMVDAELHLDSKTTIDELKSMKPVTRTSQILEILVIEKLTPIDDGIELNEGYQYTVNGAIPQLADSIAKMAFEMDKDTNLGDFGGGAFLNLVTQYYEKLRGGE